MPRRAIRNNENRAIPPKAAKIPAVKSEMLLIWETTISTGSIEISPKTLQVVFVLGVAKWNSTKKIVHLLVESIVRRWPEL
jgi:hypothetical protein